MVLSMLAIMFVEVCVLVFVSFVCLPAKDKQIVQPKLVKTIVKIYVVSCIVFLFFVLSMKGV